MGSSRVRSPKFMYARVSITSYIVNNGNIDLNDTNE